MNVDELTRLVGGYWASRAVLTAVELDLPTFIHRGAQTQEALSKASGVNVRGLDALLPVLLNFGLIENNGSGLRLTETGRLLSREQPGNLVGFLRHQLSLWHKWNRLTESVRSGLPVEAPFDVESFILAMEQGKGAPAREYFAGLDLSGARRILDLGGGPGTFAAGFAELLPEADVTLFDHPEVLAIARTRLPASLLASPRFHLLPGDFTRDPIGSDYDLIWVSAIIHAYGAGDTLALFKTCRDALAKGGRLVVRDFLLKANGSGHPFAALFALNMLVNTSGGKVYHVDEIRGLLAQSGFGSIEIIPSRESAWMVVAKEE
jgi:SAM-dependent methyltransferase